MYIIYDQKSPLTFVRRGTYTFDEMKNNPVYSDIVENETVLMVNNKSVVFDWIPLDIWKQQYNVEEEDPEKALEQIIERMNVVPLSDSERDDILTSILLDQATNEETSDIAVECIFDLYAQIDELKAHIKELTND